MINEPKEKATLRVYLTQVTKHKTYCHLDGSAIGLITATYQSKQHLEIHATLLLLGCVRDPKSSSKYDLLYGDELITSSSSYLRTVIVMQLH